MTEIEQTPTGKTVAIIPCTNQKSDTPGPAREVWIGNHFQLVLAHTEMFYDQVLVMSYKYGLISPDFVIEPYDIDLRVAKAAERLKWWFMMKGHIETLSKTEPILVALYTGNMERGRIITEFNRNGVKQVIVPFEGATIGVRMQMVYDCIPPFDLEKAQRGEYISTQQVDIPTTKYAPPPSGITGDIDWED